MLPKRYESTKSTVELGYMCPWGLTGPPALTLTKLFKYEKRLLLRCIHHYLNVCSSSGSTLENGEDSKFLNIGEEAGMRKFVQTIVPLLIECWVEATTTQHFSTADGNGLHGNGLHGNGYRKFVQTIVPLLIECWVEATTTQHFCTADGNGLHGNGLHGNGLHG